MRRRAFGQRMRQTVSIWARIIVATGATAAVLGISCRAPVEPPAPVSIGPEGQRIAQQLTFMAKSIRAVIDVRQAIRPYPFDHRIFDSIGLSIVLWNPQSVDSLLSPSVGEASHTAVAPFLATQAMIDRNIGDKLQQLLYESHSARHDTVPFRLAFNADSTALEPPWSGISDTVVGRLILDAGETTAVVDSLYRYRMASIDGFAVEDLEIWQYTDSATVSLVYKRQTHGNGERIVFSHSVTCNADVVNDTVVSIAPTVRRVLLMKRKDNSTQWWKRSGESVLLTYSDSVIWQGGVVAVTRLDSMYCFTDSSKVQSVAVQRLLTYPSGEVERSQIRFIQIVQPNADSLISYGQSDYLRNEGIRRYRLAGLTDAEQVCTLWVSVLPSAPYRQQTSWGLIDSTSYRCVIVSEEEWSSVRSTALRRIDYFRGGERIARIETDLFPKAPIELGSHLRGTVTTTVYHSNANRTVLQRWVWSDGDDAAADTVRYLWVGINRDSIFLTTVLEQQGSWSYRMRRLPLFGRFGVVERRSADSLSLRDTLMEAGESLPCRIIEAFIDTMGNGRMLVLGPETLRIVAGAGSMVVEPMGAWTTLAVPAIEWKKSGDSLYRADYRDGESSHRYIASFTFGVDGYLEGCFDVFKGSDPTAQTRVAAATAISIGPLYVGSAQLSGIFSNAPAGDPFGIQARAELQLWGINSLGTSDELFQWP